MQALLPAIVRKKQPVGDMQEIVLLSIDDVHWHHTRILATKNVFYLTAWFELRFTQINPSTVFSTFDKDQLGKIHQLR